MAMRSERHKREPPPPLTREDLERLALSYAGRYAATRAKLRSYLARKLRERGWAGTGEPAIEQIVRRFADLGYVNDQAFALSRSEALGRRGYGARRVDQALKIAGIEDADGEAARELARSEAWNSAVRFAQKKRIGPFAETRPERPVREKAVGAMLRAGHSIRLSRLLVEARPGEVPEQDDN